MAKPKTNVQFVKELMEFSQHGPMAQLFVLQAIEKYAKACANAEPEEMDNGIISGYAWQAVAKEIHEKCEARYAKPAAKSTGHKHDCFGNHSEWSGSPNPDNPDAEWICDECGGIISAK